MDAFIVRFPSGGHVGAREREKHTMGEVVASAIFTRAGWDDRYAREDELEPCSRREPAA